MQKQTHAGSERRTDEPVLPPSTLDMYLDAMRSQGVSESIVRELVRK
jgi:hypothetical protein